MLHALCDILRIVWFCMLGHMVTIAPLYATFGGQLSQFRFSRNVATFNTPKSGSLYHRCFHFFSSQSMNKAMY